jgi:hypothetical protein
MDSMRPLIDREGLKTIGQGILGMIAFEGYNVFIMNRYMDKVERDHTRQVDELKQVIKEQRSLIVELNNERNNRRGLLGYIWG